MRTLFSGEVHVHYGQMYIESGDRNGGAELSECFRGQANGLCGAAVPGHLFLITGLHTGNVRVTVELLDEEPQLDNAWEDVVEVPFHSASREASLVDWEGRIRSPLRLEEVGYRVRYCAIGMDKAHEMNVRMDQPGLDMYLLQFWPAPAEPDRVLKQTSHKAAYWHGCASKLHAG